eukprot:201916_1
MTQLCETKGSILKLVNNKWKVFKKGQLILLYNKYHDTQPVLIKLIAKNTNNIHIFQSKPKTKLKNKSLILKAIYTKINQEFIIAIRFNSNQALLFQSKIQNIARHIQNCSEPFDIQSDCDICKSQKPLSASVNSTSSNDQITEIKNDADYWDEDEFEENIPINDILFNITENISTFDISSTMMSDILLLTHNSYIKSTLLLNSLLQKCKDTSISFAARIRSITMCETWMKTYWTDFQLDNNMIILMDNFIDCEIDANDVHTLCNWLYKCENKNEFHDKMIHLVNAFIITSKNDYYPNELVLLILGYIDKHSILLYNIKVIYMKQSNNNNECIKTYNSVMIDIPTNYNVIMDESAESIAEQLTLMDFEVFKNVRKKSLIAVSWKKKDRDKRAPYLLKLIKQFNQISKWVQCIILVQINKRSRVKIIEKMIKISIHLKKLQNYSACSAVNSGLSCNTIYRLKDAWNGVSKKYLKSYHEIQDIYKGKRSWSELRILHKNANPPAIFHIGVFLQDLLNVDEGYTDYNKNCKINPRQLNSTYKLVHIICKFQQSEYVNIAPNYIIQQSIKNDWEKQMMYDEEKLWKISRVVRNKDRDNENIDQTKLFTVSREEKCTL